MKIHSKVFLFGLILGLLPLWAHGQQSLLGKFYVSSVKGTVTCVVDGKVIELKKGDIIPAGGTIIQTTKGSSLTFVLSNGTSVFADENTKFAITKFDQEPFAPNNNLLMEPSNTQSHIQVLSGRMVISTPQLQSGTSMVFETPHSSTNLVSSGTETGGEKVLIEVTDTQSHVALLSGNVNIMPRGANGDFISLGEHITTGQQAFVKYTLTEAKDTDANGNPIAPAANTDDPDAKKKKKDSTSLTVTGGAEGDAVTGHIPGSTGDDADAGKGGLAAAVDKPTSVIVTKLDDSLYASLGPDLDLLSQAQSEVAFSTDSQGTSTPTIVVNPVIPTQIKQDTITSNSSLNNNG